SRNLNLSSLAGPARRSKAIPRRTVLGASIIVVDHIGADDAAGAGAHLDAPQPIAFDRLVAVDRTAASGRPDPVKAVIAHDPPAFAAGDIVSVIVITVIGIVDGISGFIRRRIIAASQSNSDADMGAGPGGSRLHGKSYKQSDTAGSDNPEHVNTPPRFPSPG